MPSLAHLALALLLGASVPAQTQTWPDRIQALVDSTVTADGLPSLQIAVGHGGDVIYEAASGFADLEHRVLATAATRYRTASISKWFTGTAAMRLVEQGRLDLDAPVQAACPRFPETPTPVTARQLLSHTSGVRHYLDPDALRADAATPAGSADVEVRILEARVQAVTRRTDVQTPLGAFADDALLFEPGTGFAYSSFGYRLLGRVVEGAPGRPFRDVLQSEVFTPAGIAVVDDDAWAIVPHRAAGYQRLVGGALRRASLRDVSENLPASGHLATAGEVAALAQAFDAGRLVAPATIAVMATPPLGPDGQSVPTGYGHGADLIGGFPDSLGHPGSQDGTTTLVVLLPDEDLSVAMMTNASGWGDAKEVVSNVLAIVRPHVAG